MPPVAFDELRTLGLRELLCDMLLAAAMALTGAVCGESESRDE